MRTESQWIKVRSHRIHGNLCLRPERQKIIYFCSGRKIITVIPMQLNPNNLMMIKWKLPCLRLFKCIFCHICFVIVLEFLNYYSKLLQASSLYRNLFSHNSMCWTSGRSSSGYLWAWVLWVSVLSLQTAPLLCLPTPCVLCTLVERWWVSLCVSSYKGTWVLWN